MPSSPPNPPPRSQSFEIEVRALIEAARLSLTEMTGLIRDQAASMEKIQTTLARAVPSAPSGGGGTAPSPGESTSSLALGDAAMRRQLLRTLSSSKGKKMSAAEFATAMSEDGRSESASTGGQNWTDMVNTKPQYYLAHFPGAHATPADAAKYFGTLAANRANKKMAGNMSTISDMLTSGDAKGDDNEYTKEFMDLVNKTAAGGFAGSLSRGAANVGQGYMTGQAVSDTFKRIAEPLNNLRTYGLQTGATSTSSPMFLGMRSPLDLAGGLGQKFSQFGFAASHNVTPDQAGMIYNNLFQQGWYGGGSTNAMRTAAAQMMNQNPYIASQPGYYSMMDQSTRYGSASLSEFNTTMSQVPQAAQAAHQSITDMMTAMESMGKFNQSIGGTFQGGLNTATDWATGTGMPPQIMQQLMQSPMVTGQIFAQTGLPPMMQGLASGAQKSQGIFSALNMVNSAVLGPPTKQYTDPITGLTSTISQQDQKIAMMTRLFPGMSTTVLKTMLNNEKGFQAGMNMMGTARIYRNAVGGAVDREHGPDAASHAQDAINDLTGAPWQKTQAAMKAAIDSQGHHIFESWSTYRWAKQHHPHWTDAQAHAFAQARARSLVTNAGDTAILKAASGKTISQNLKGILTDKQRQSQTHDKRDWNWLNDNLDQRQRATLAQRILASGHVSGKTEKLIGEARKKAMEANVNRNTQKFGPGSSNNNGPSLTIGLSKAASKYFNLVGAPGDAKSNQNAGAQAANTANISLPSYPPQPDMNTQSDYNSQL